MLRGTYSDGCSGGSSGGNGGGGEAAGLETGGSMQVQGGGEGAPQEEEATGSVVSEAARQVLNLLAVLALKCQH